MIFRNRNSDICYYFNFSCKEFAKTILPDLRLKKFFFSKFFFRFGILVKFDVIPELGLHKYAQKTFFFTFRLFFSLLPHCAMYYDIRLLLFIPIQKKSRTKFKNQKT